MLKTKGHKILHKLGWRDFLDTEFNPRAEQFLDTRGYDVLNQTVSNIDRALKPKNNWKEINLLPHPNSTAIMYIPKKEFGNVLDYAMEWFKEKEYYEMCQFVLDIQKKLEQNPS